MERLSQKIAIFAAVYSAVLFMCACVQPPSINDFLEDPEVKEKIVRDRVTLVDKTGEGLRVGNKMILGLNASHYYMVRVEAIDEEGEPLDAESGYRYVSKDGTLSENLIDIRRVSSRSIINLNNNYIYTVWTASPLTGSMTIYDVSSNALQEAISDNDGTVLTADNGRIALATPVSRYYIELPQVITPDTKILMVPVSPEGKSSLVNFITGNIIALRGAGTTTDYIFADTAKNGDVTLKVLYTDISPRPDGSDPTIVIEFEIPDGSLNLTITGTTGTITQSALIAGAASRTYTVTGTNPGFDSAQIAWTYNDAPITSAATSTTWTFKYDEDDPDTEEYLIKGTHSFTVDITIDEETYSIPFGVVVN